MELRKELSYFLQSLDGDDLRNLADGNTTEERLIDEYLDIKAEAKQRAAHHQMLEGATVKAEKPTINDYPITDERTFLNLNGSVNWQRYAKALDAYIETTTPQVTPQATPPVAERDVRILICNKCGTTRAVRGDDKPCCTAAFPQRTSGICGGELVEITTKERS